MLDLRMEPEPSCGMPQLTTGHQPHQPLGIQRPATGSEGSKFLTNKSRLLFASDWASEGRWEVPSSSSDVPSVTCILRLDKQLIARLRELFFLTWH
ncbi:hypothetical protein P7K49_025992 [Saguinus oedipus]|uniref:Uncharacterized protein n=1 Tax=Saguinus oedipus TaxID=9490 RepID=A0ABQ9UIT1_SAGOE|nr:hypothetical protein P7K49_025992 [Saguinus oedipus]